MNFSTNIDITQNMIIKQTNAINERKIDILYDRCGARSNIVNETIHTAIKTHIDKNPGQKYSSPSGFGGAESPRT